ncbi:MAG: methyltransferase domain-containing protein [Sandaracinaceae bacterium]|jgi:hypothetical protein|nr:methyltransferase domain-containing protein [Sandaracinaceae bacterium]MBP7681440.1 methyltransferase domain-containing protein [Deltaproteobacteria bacterium]MBK6807513.1 methyltransferase domain-containing protein [Sandaracinaceae bacterium]MBK7152321.1 methyltransferase domain-containing protein [Sandaracinaceae bacterium]MBK7774542.1 methyltransferase domain-containing protein [Sandaracinaceae bacterium]
MHSFSDGSRSRLTHRDVGRFPGETLFDRVGRVVCEAECLPRKELYESWEVAKRARRRMRGGVVYDLAAGHGLLAHLLLLLDDSSPHAVAVDKRTPPSADTLHAALVAAWPRLEGRIERRVMDLRSVQAAEGDLVVSAHACGGLTDATLDVALASRAGVAVLPCCHVDRTGDTGGLLGWMDGALAMDVTRAGRLRAAGYHVLAQTIPETITPKNRLLLGWL